MPCGLSLNSCKSKLDAEEYIKSELSPKGRFGFVFLKFFEVITMVFIPGRSVSDSSEQSKKRLLPPKSAVQMKKAELSPEHSDRAAP